MAGGIREQHGDELSENHEINVTPFIDVMLVLLIIFMVAAPLATVDINVDLPASTAKPAERPEEPLYLTVKEDLSLNIGNDAVGREQLAATLDRVTEGKKDTRVFLRADKAVDYGQFMEVMNLLRDSGYLKIALVGLETLPAPAAPAAPAPAGNAPAAAPAVPATGGNP
ncbi:TonB system transport protein ExbD [Neorhizobium galegae]|uniref:TonB system transport protein ExbD n=1 Tax=Neorhizobium galegae TaxID=399 RepID=UPI001F196933|nr:TonB system transport protein ExbD [Neorhizobium galegae]MCQ1834841.1 TonB system transport protein ExbD [Neorhizobium galegae]UIK05669.1 TonB system transport protein ExbD [Neorhizobium galegae]UIY29698.1 TonB system transport protein ExbD [Neorhizobium galegae]